MSVEPKAPNGEKRDSQTGLATDVGQYAGYGLTIGLATALFAWFGDWLDERLHTEPLFVVIGAFLGFSAAFYSMYWRLVIKGNDAGRGENGA